MIPLFSIIFQIFLELVMILFYPFAWTLNFIGRENNKEGKKGTIVIIERWFNTNVFHKLWVEYLRKNGYEVHLISPPLGTGSFEDSVKEVKEYITRNNLSDFTLVGISTGGITAYLYLKEYGGWDRVRHFISLGAPFAGTYAYLPLFLFKSCRVMLPGSSFVKALLERPIENVDRIVCVRAVFDQFIPKDNQILPGAHVEVVPVVGHNNLHLYSSKTYKLLLQLVEEKE